MMRQTVETVELQEPPAQREPRTEEPENNVQEVLLALLVEQAELLMAETLRHPLRRSIQAEAREHRVMVVPEHPEAAD